MFPNLNAELARVGISKKTLAKGIKMNYYTLKSRMNGKSDFKCIEMRLIKRKFFPNLTIDYLFATEDEIKKNCRNDEK